MSDTSLWAGEFAAGCEHLYAVAVSSDDPDWPVLKDSYYDGSRYDADGDFCGPQPLATVDSIGLSPNSPVFSDRPLSSRWIFSAGKLWEFAFIDGREPIDQWIRADNPQVEWDSLRAAVQTFRLKANNAAVILNLQAEPIDELRRIRIEHLLGPHLREDATDLWYAALLRTMPETQSGPFRIRKTRASVFAESVALSKAIEAEANELRQRGFDEESKSPKSIEPSALPVEVSSVTDDGLPRSSPPDQTPMPTSAVSVLAKLTGTDLSALLQIAHDANRTGEDKFDAMVKLDSRLDDQLNSEEWGQLLGVTSNAVRQYRPWKMRQERRKRPD